MRQKAKKQRITRADFQEMDETFQKALDVARALDERRPIPHSVTIRAITLEALLTTLTPQRRALLKIARKYKERSIAELADAARRDRSAVSKDIAKLAELGLVTVELESNAGHGLKKVVRPVAKNIELQFAI